MTSIHCVLAYDVHVLYINILSPHIKFIDIYLFHHIIKVNSSIRNRNKNI